MGRRGLAAGALRGRDRRVRLDGGTTIENEKKGQEKRGCGVWGVVGGRTPSQRGRSKREKSGEAARREEKAECLRVLPVCTA